MYSKILWEHATRPRNQGDLPDADAVGEARYPICGDWLRLSFQLSDGRVTEVRFRSHGCGAARAAGSVATELLKGRAIDHARNLTAFELNEALDGVIPSKRHALLMVLQCIAEALGSREHIKED